MFGMIARRRGQVLVEAGVDKVIWAISLPQDALIRNVRGKVDLIGTSDFSFILGTFYGLEMYVLPVFDPDATNVIQTLFDQLVPKDTAVQAIDLDTGATDATPFFEPGEVNWAEVLDIGVRPEKMYSRYKMLNATNALFMGRDPETPFSLEMRLGDSVEVQVAKTYRVKQPSVVALAIATPVLDQTADDVLTLHALEEDEWGRIKYAELMLEHAMIDLLGLTESGAETPWEEATDLLQEYLEPPMTEDTSGNWTSAQFNTYHDFKMDIWVPGRVSVKMLTTGR